MAWGGVEWGWVVRQSYHCLIYRVCGLVREDTCGQTRHTLHYLQHIIIIKYCHLLYINYFEFITATKNTVIDI